MNHFPKDLEPGVYSGPDEERILILSVQQPEKPESSSYTVVWGWMQKPRYGVPGPVVKSWLVNTNLGESDLFLGDGWYRVDG